MGVLSAMAPKMLKAPTSPTAPTKVAPFDAQEFLDSADVSKKIVEYRRSAVIFAQGDPCDSVMYIQKGALGALSRWQRGDRGRAGIW